MELFLSDNSNPKKKGKTTMGKIKTLPATAVAPSNYELFQQLVIDALKHFEFESDESWTVVKTTGFVKYVIQIKNKNLSKLNKVAWDIKDLADLNNCSDVFGCQLLQGTSLSFYDMIVFDL